MSSAYSNEEKLSLHTYVLSVYENVFLIHI